uniref:Scavenger receptor class F member 1 n=1 Tax=Spermophilus dauricus TaxID=99837 RepID=A0A8C9Q8D3_SPEDA
MGLRLLILLLLLWTAGIQGSELDPNGQHVCMGRYPLNVCAPDFQTWVGCFSAICEGLDACQKDEICVKPGLCRCKPGFFGAQCSSRESQLQDESGAGSELCSRRTGCQMFQGLSLSLGGLAGPLCFEERTGQGSVPGPEPIQCSSTSQCDQTTGACLCHSGWWGRRCSFRCSCNGSPCEQLSGRCICQPGWWDSECRQKCQCVRGLCSATSGQCSCPPGFHGARCELPCAPGSYGVQCSKSCGQCEQNASCSPDTGHCESCKPGWDGTQCQQPCSPGTFGKNCSQQCPRCRLGEACQPETGHCRHPTEGHFVFCALTTLPTPLLRPVRDGAALSRMKQQVWGALTSLGSALSCGSLSRHKLPWVTVSHHDPEVPFNHSFIEPPSAGWASDDSFSSDPESGVEDEVPAYCVPPQQGMVPVTHAESAEASLAGGPFPPPEDTSTPFAIPRTSSLARAKRPSVSFAEGTKFASQSCRSSGELSSPFRKPKRLSRGAQPGPEGQEAKESATLEQGNTDEAAPATASPGDSAIDHQYYLEDQTAAECVEAIDSGVKETSDPVATIYMLAGTPQRSEGPVLSIFRHFGNFWKGQAEAKVKTAIPKPPRRALGQNKNSPGLASSSASQRPGAIAKPPRRARGQNKVRSEEVSRGVGDGIESSGRAQEPVIGNSPPEQDLQKQAEEEGQEEPLYENVVLVSGPPES